MSNVTAFQKPLTPYEEKKKKLNYFLNRITKLQFLLEKEEENILHYINKNKEILNAN
jgi:hypothetical protein